MTKPNNGNDRKHTMGGGALIALSIMAGTIGGGLMGQPSAGLLAGTGIGTALALLLYLYDRSRGA
ncbi:hypothetical protein WG908_06725 [Sphingobium sp. AN641]|uniref:hypothetical protein n=1 Tax=Sphingobium sp. AN641 TaxID=3133443 RepID=UPI0030BF1187